MILLETRRLRLRPFHDTDLESFLAYRSDPEVARFQSWTAPYSREKALAFLEELRHAQAGAPGVWYQLAIERLAQPGIIGDCAFQVLTDDPRQAQIGYTMSGDFQRQGLASEAVRRLLVYLFCDLGLHRVTATCDVENQASVRLLERIGMRREAHFIESIWFKDAWGNEYSYALLCREWNLARPANDAPG